MRQLSSGKISSALQHLWQVFAEPALADTYTPRSGDVFASVDREVTRIGWDTMLRYGRFRLYARQMMVVMRSLTLGL